METVKKAIHFVGFIIDLPTAFNIQLNSKSSSLDEIINFLPAKTTAEEEEK